MEQVINILDYLYLKYPNPNQLSISRVMKLLYLIEWRYAITKYEKLTDIEWINTEYGPFYKSLKDIFKDSSNFNIEDDVDDTGRNQTMIRFLNKKENISLKEGTKEVVNFVIDICKDYSWVELNNLVNSTYGIINTSQGEIINVVELAKKYKGKE